MLKKTITFKDLDGNEITEDFYFGLNKAELAKLEITREGGLETHLRKIVAERDGQAIVDQFEQIIRMSIGRRSEDGRRFIKSDEIADEFMQTDAYSELFLELITDAEKAASFIRGVVPSDLKEAIDKGKAVEEISVDWGDNEALPEPKDDTPAWIQEGRQPTKQELMEMPKSEMIEAFKRFPGLAT